jgi:hypothetical protein
MIRASIPLLVAPTAKSSVRTLLVDDPVIGAAEHKNLKQLLEDYPIRYAGLVASQRVLHSPLGQQGYELFPDRLNEV